MKKRRQLGLPNELIVLHDNNGIELYCLDIGSPEGSRIVVWDVPSGNVRAEKAGSLFQFILNESADWV